MRRVWLGASTALIMLIMAMTGLPYWIGFMAERQYRTFLEHNKPFSELQLAPMHYQRGWFASKATTRVTVPSDETEASANDSELTFLLAHRIYHGILPLAWWFQEKRFSPEPVQAMVHTVPIGDAPWMTRLTNLYQDRQPLEIISRIHLNGSSAHRVRMPPLDIQGREQLDTLAFSGLEGRLFIPPAGHSIEGTIHLPALLISAPEAPTVRLRGLRLNFEQHPGRFRLMLGKTTLTLEEFRMRYSGRPDILPLFEDISLTTQVTEDKDTIGSNVALSADRIELAGEPLGNAQLNLAITGLDSSRLRTIRQWHRQRMMPPKTAALPVTDILATLQELLARHPALTLTMRADTPQGILRADAELVFQAFSRLRLQDPATLLQVLARATAEVSISKPLLENILRYLLKSQLRHAANVQEETIDETKLTAFAARRVQDQLNRLLNARFIQVKEGRYWTRLHYDRGRLLINGMRLPLFGLLP